MIFVLEDLELWDIVEAVVPPILVTAPVLVAEFRKRNKAAKRTICDTVCDHIIPHLTSLFDEKGLCIRDVGISMQVV
jgi:hypothetical protein